MISIKDYYGVKSHPALTPVIQANAQIFLGKLNRFIALGIQEGQLFLNSPATKTQLSTDVGGWRPPDCPTGAPLSSHKIGRAADLYDGVAAAFKTFEGKPVGMLGYWVLTSPKAKVLAKELGLYFEHPTVTKGVHSFWLHATDKAPASGKMLFYP